MPRKRQLEVRKRIWIGAGYENRLEALSRDKALEREHAKRDQVAAGRGVVGSATSKLDILYEQLAVRPRYGLQHNQMISWQNEVIQIWELSPLATGLPS